MTDVQPTGSLRRHVSLADWDKSGSPIFRVDGSLKLLSVLQRATLGFGCWLVDEQELPRWLERKELGALGPGAAASIVLGSQLAVAAERIELAKCLLPHVGNLSVRSAIRYLMHGRADHSTGDAWLLLPIDGNQAVWERLIQHVVPTPPWRVISREWSGVFAANDLDNLHVAPLNEEGAWSILSDLKSDWRQTVFGDDWTESELRRVLEGLWQAGARDWDATKRLLRRLPIHALRSDPRSRTAICNSEGQLEDSYIFDDPDFHRAIDDSLLPLWSEFLIANRVIQRFESPTAAAIQAQLFTVTVGTEAVVHELKWNYVLRYCLAEESPDHWVRLILRALEHGHQHLKGIHSIVARTPWLPLAAGGAISPKRVVDLPGMAEYLYRLVDPNLDGWATERALPEWVTTAPSRPSLAEFFARGEQALDIVAVWCTDKPQWHLGILPVYLPDDRSEFLRHAESLDSVRAAALIAELVRHPFSDVRNQSATPEEWAALVWSTLEGAVCRAFEGDLAFKRQQYAQILRSTANTAKKTVFNAYLKQAVHEGFTDLVAELAFCSQTREWLPAKRLTWPSANIEPEFQVCQDQADILKHDNFNECAPDGGDPAITDNGNRLATIRLRAGSRASQLHDEGDRERKFANDSLEKLLKQPSHPGQHALIAAIRRKMEQFQYTPASMLLELFQNADDAAVELSEMRGGSTSDFGFRVSLESASRELCIVHWGRPINQYLGPAFDGQSRGYHQDLAKMLTLNFSDKAVARDNEPLIETGKFGLGFKTVFFLADEPEVLSGRLAFRIKGGFFPIPLSTSDIAELRAVSGIAPSKAKLTATVVRLRLSESSASSAEQLIRGFATRANLLTQFARKLRTVEVTIDGESHSYASERVELWPKAHMARTDGGGILLFDCPVPHDSHGATVAMKMGVGGMEPFAPDVPRLWVTTPLSEQSAADFALNAPLSPDAGRQRVVPSSPENQRIILAVSEGFFSHLETLDDRAIEDWAGLHNSLQLPGWPFTTATTDSDFRARLRAQSNSLCPTPSTVPP